MNRINLSEEEIDKKIFKSLNKIPFEMKKVRIYLFFLKYFNSLKKIFKK